MTFSRRRVLLVAGVLLGLWAVACALLLVRAARDLQAGRDAAEQARDGLDAEAVAEGTALEPLREAADRFGSAESATGNVVLAPLRVLPIVGRQLRSVHALSGAAGAVASAGAAAVDRAQEVLDEPAGGGPARVDQVRIIAETLRAAADRVAEVDDLGPREGLLGPLAEARNDLAEELDEARTTLADAVAGTEAALALVEGPRTYLLVAANNAEMRAGSGMWLTGGLLTTAAGRLDLDGMSPLSLDADPPDDAVALTDDDLAANWGWMNPQDEWRSLMASPRLEVSAELGARMWAAAGRPPVDGVLVVDPVALQAVVAATRPVVVAGETYEAEEIPAALLHDQYADFGTSGPDQGARREVLGAVASAAFGALDEGEWSPATLVEELGRAIRGRHVLAWSSDEVEQQGWEAAGMDGAVDASSLLVSILNRGGNKLDWFLDVDASLAFADDEAVVRVDIANRTPDGEVEYVAGPNPELTDELVYGDYKGVLAVTMPDGAVEPVFEGRTTVNVKGPDGPTEILGVQFVLAKGEATSFTLRFGLPDGLERLRVEPSARFPATSWTFGDLTWEDAEPRTLELP